MKTQSPDTSLEAERVLIEPIRIPALVALLKQHYLVEEDALQKGQDQHSSFSLLHLDSLLKIDVIVPHMGEFDTSMA